jgi:saccharopine dehydrogenase-like NADP-dependent oxidoreductase
MQAISELGLLNDDRVRTDIARMSYGQWLREFVPGSGDLRQDIARRLNLPVDHPVIKRLEWLGLFTDEPIAIEAGSNLDVLAKAMLARMAYKPRERDMIVLHHQFEVEYPNRHRELLESTLIDYGEPDGDTAMARTVSLPAAIAVRMILEGKIKLTGVQIPVRRELYEPVLNELSKIGISFRERTQVVS